MVANTEVGFIPTQSSTDSRAPPTGASVGGASLVRTVDRDAQAGDVRALVRVARAHRGDLAMAAACVGLGLQPLQQVRVVRLEGRPLRADARDRLEVVSRRRGAGRPFEAVPEAPRVVGGRDL